MKFTFWYKVSSLGLQHTSITKNNIITKTTIIIQAQIIHIISLIFSIVSVQGGRDLKPLPKIFCISYYIEQRQ